MPTHFVLVQSTPRPASPITHSTFNKWYDEIHIPDLLVTPGVRSASRYRSLARSQPFPYLAVYPHVSKTWLSSPDCEFLKVPLHHDMLPGPSHFVFDAADFVMGVYEVVGRAGRGTVKEVKAVVLQVLEGGDAGEEVLERCWDGLGLGSGAVRSVLGRWDFNPAGGGRREEEGVFVGKGMLALHELEELPEEGTEGGVVMELIKAFGDAKATV